MRPINLLSLIQARRSLREDAFEKYIGRHEIIIRNREIDDLHSLTEQLRGDAANDQLFDKHYVSYEIPQIGKEFDLLRFGHNYHLNIEVKSDCNTDKIKKQLIKNKYYLSYLGRETFSITYSSLTNQFFQLNADEILVDIPLDRVRTLLMDQVIDEDTPIDHRFNPSAYLVSPFNSPEKFLSNQFFLTSQQQDVKRRVLDLVRGDRRSVYISITGAAGTGKTLLAYDIAADEIRIRRTPLIIHCGKLNNGHLALNQAGWKIVPIRNLRQHDLNAFDSIFIDEAQRIRPDQFEQIMEHIARNGGRCIFSHDRSQTLADHETRNDMSQRITLIPGVALFSLSEKIRTNKEIADFIKSFVDKNRGLKVKNTGNIELVYFSDAEDARRHLQSLDGEKWEVIRFTPSQYRNEHHEAYSPRFSNTSHDVIGQEFDAVAVTIDRFFSYNGRGALVYTGDTYYQPAKMLFQNMTRARNRLRVVIIENPELLDACMEIFE